MSSNTTSINTTETGSSYTIDSGDTGWIMLCSTFVFLMSPALGFFYAGLARAKNALSLMYLTVLSVAVVSFQWYLIGYSLTFSETGTSFIGDSRHFLLRGVGRAPQYEGQTIPAFAFMIFQCMFAAITPGLAFGSAAERMSLGPAILFIFIWTTLVYDIITCWVWSPNGFLLKLGVIDFAGGTPVHISSGLAAVAYAIVLGKRRDYDMNVNTPHNISFVFLGLGLMWFGWFCFNAGSAYGANAHSVHSLICTHISACVASVVWVLMDYFHSRKWSIIGLCTGAVAGLATITPGSGYVTYSSALAFGALGAIISNVIIRYKHKLGFDDALDVFAVHYIGGLVGLVLTGIFAQQKVIALGFPQGTPQESMPKGGWLDGNWIQVPIQLAAIAAVSAWSFVVTYIILIVLNKIPSLTLRLGDEDEMIGTDWAEMGERAYGYLPIDEEQVRLEHLEEGQQDIFEQEQEQAISNGREVQLEEHVNGAMRQPKRSWSGVDLHLNTEPSAIVASGTSKGKKIKRNLRRLVMTRKKDTIGAGNQVEESIELDYTQKKDSVTPKQPIKSPKGKNRCIDEVDELVFQRPPAAAESSSGNSSTLVYNRDNDNVPFKN
ncbi:ammonium transporter [Backusella circina FSU 941]|nr:ammonium transporter [Backusella circina FSU 941]